MGSSKNIKNLKLSAKPLEWNSTVVTTDPLSKKDFSRVDTNKVVPWTSGESAKIPQVVEADNFGVPIPASFSQHVKFDFDQSLFMPNEFHQEFPNRFEHEEQQDVDMLSAMFLETTPTLEKPATIEQLGCSSKKKRYCSELGCKNRSRTQGKCKRHGGGKRCSIDGCQSCAVSNSLCVKHGGGKKCSVNRCSTAAQSKGLCKKHGGGSRCRIKSCNRSSQSFKLCGIHGGGKTCAIVGCTSKVQKNGKCSAHKLFDIVDNQQNLVIVQI